MKWLVKPLRVPLEIVKHAHQARLLYPYVIWLVENVATYQRICERVSEKRSCQLLVDSMKKDIQNSIMDMSNLLWDSLKIKNSIEKFANAIDNFREKVDELVTVETSIEQQLKELDACEYQKQRFASILYEIQTGIDNLNLNDFSNLRQWVARLDEEVERKFAGRLNAAIRVWVDVLTDRKRRQDDEDSVIRRRGRDEKRANVEPAFAALFEEFLGGVDSLEAGEAQKDDRQLQEHFAKTIKIKQLVLEILIRNQVLYVSPSIEVRIAKNVLCI